MLKPCPVVRFRQVTPADALSQRMWPTASAVPYGRTAKVICESEIFTVGPPDRHHVVVLCPVWVNSMMVSPAQTPTTCSSTSSADSQSSSHPSGQGAFQLLVPWNSQRTESDPMRQTMCPAGLAKPARLSPETVCTAAVGSEAGVERAGVGRSVPAHAERNRQTDTAATPKPREVS